jgi:uncharacterized protein YutE (UPF0331/DUF86 family)
MDEKHKKRILFKLDDMTRYVEELKMMLPSKEDYLLDLILRRACEKTVESAIETLIDVAAIIVSSEKIGLPKDEESIFDLLNKKKILDASICKKAKEMKGFRNILIHRYADTNNETVYNHLNEHISDFYEFERQVKLYLKKK